MSTPVLIRLEILRVERHGVKLVRARVPRGATKCGQPGTVVRSEVLAYETPYRWLFLVYRALDEPRI